MTLEFDPDEPRDPDGKWSGGLPDVIQHEPLHLGGHDGLVESLPGAKVRFKLGDSDLEMARDYGAGQVTSAIAQGEDGKPVVDVLDENRRPVLRFRFTQHEGDTSASLEFVGQDSTVHLSAGELRSLSDAFTRAAAARRFDLPSGPVDTFLDGKKFAVRTKIRRHHPVTKSFDRQSFTRLSVADSKVFDSEGDSFKVATNEGPMLVSRTPGAGGQGFHITIGPESDEPWFITHGTAPGDPWDDAVEALDAGGAALGHYERSAAPSSTRPDTGGTPMTWPSAALGQGADLQVQRSQYAARRTAGKSDRFVRQFHVRAQMSASGDSGTTLDGYASVTGSPYSVRDWLGEYDETIERGAFAKTLSERDDVRLLLNHDGLPLARTSSGTMALSEDDQGLHVTAELDKRSNLTNDVAIAMERGDLTEMSFAFAATRQAWNEDYTQRSISEVKLYDVSVVTYPANPATTVKLRSADVEQLTDEELRELVARAQRRLAPQIDASVLDGLRVAMNLA